MSKVSLVKERELKVTVSLEKKTKRKISCRVNLIVDVSGSMDGAFRTGGANSRVQSIFEKIFPIAYKFTPNGRLGIFIFSNDCRKLPKMTIKNFEGYVEREIVRKGYVDGGTNYAPAIKAAIADDGLTFWERIVKWVRILFGIEKRDSKKFPVFNIFITDGGNNDEHDSERAIIRSSFTENFFQCVGTWGHGFNFLKRLDTLSGRHLDNVNFFQLDDIDSISDEDLYDRLLNEFPVWLDLAEKDGII